MGNLYLIHPGSGAPEWCSIEVWQAVSGRPVLCAPGDVFGTRLAEAGLDVREIAEAASEALQAVVEGEPPPPASRRVELRLLVDKQHGHGGATAGEQALAERLVSLAAELGECAFLLPAASDPVVRAVLERALQGDVQIEVVIGRAPRGHRLLEVVRVMARLRGPGGCPWDAEQTHQTLAKYLIDETYELLHAIEEGSSDDIAEELGDVLLQVVFHAQMGQDAETFDVDDVAEGLVRKLVTRHPHVFGDVTVSGAGEVVANWDAIKEHEKGRTGVHDDIPEALPALAWAAKLQRRAGKAGFDWDDASGPMQKVREELGELERAGPDEREHELGDLLLAVVGLSRHLDVDAESALRLAARRFRDRVTFVESAARDRGATLRDLSEQELAALWTQAKRR